jgi:hypothetical protein
MKLNKNKEEAMWIEAELCSPWGVTKVSPGDEGYSYYCLRFWWKLSHV